MSDETGKCKKARLRVEAIGEQVKAVKQQLSTAHNELLAITDPKAKEGAPTEKIGDLTRIKVSCKDLDLYIDFCLVSDGDDIEGAIVYGALREPCYPHSLLPNPDGKKEERPLVCFSVDDLGKISSRGKLEDEWWLSGSARDRKKMVAEVHYRALDLIWRDALNWVSKPLLP